MLDTHLSFSECKICGWFFIGTKHTSCLMCGAVVDEEYKAEDIDYNSIAKDNKSNKDYENGERSY